MPSKLQLFAVALTLSFTPFGAFAQDEISDDDLWLDELLGLEGEDVFGDEEISEASLAEAREALEAIQTLTEWSFDSGLAVGLGYKNNALLEESGGVDSAYVQAEVDLFAFKPGLAGSLEMLGVLYAEYRYFDDVPGLDAESLVLGQGSVGLSFGEKWKGSIVFEGVRSDQAYDASLVEFETEATSVVFWEPQLGVMLGREMDRWGTLSATLFGAEAFYDIDGEDYRTNGLKVQHESEFGKGSTLRLDAVLYQESYDERKERFSNRFSAEDEGLKLDGSQLRGEWIFRPDSAWLKRMKTRLSYETEDDKLGDYYERDNWQARQSVDLEFGEWEIDLAVTFGKTSYAYRRTSLVSQETRADELWRWEVQARRPVSEWATLFARLEGSEKRSNTSGLSYAGESLMLGVSLLEN